MVLMPALFSLQPLLGHDRGIRVEVVQSIPVELQDPASCHTIQEIPVRWTDIDTFQKYLVESGSLAVGHMIIS